MGRTTLADMLRYNREEIFEETLDSAAKRIGITKGHLHDLESGRHLNPTFKVLKGICAAYKISPTRLFEDT